MSTIIRSIVVSNGSDFFEIDESDLPAAREEGFYVPHERGLAVVSNGEETLEIPLDDLESARADGYDLLSRLPQEAAGDQPEPDDQSERPEAGAPEHAAGADSTEQTASTTGEDTPAGQEQPSSPTDTRAAGEKPSATHETAAEKPAKEEKPSTKPARTAEAQPATETKAAVEAKRAAEDEAAAEDEPAEEERAPDEESSADDKSAKKKSAAKSKASFAAGVARELSPSEKRALALTSAVSVAVHVLILAALAFYVLDVGGARETFDVLVSRIEEPLEDQPVVEIETEATQEKLEQDVEPVESQAEEVFETDSNLNLDPDVPEPPAMPEPIQSDAPSPSANVEKRGDLAGRASASARQAALKAYGGSEASERAVARGLKWLATIQQRNGSWNFGEVGQAGGAGTLKDCPTGATGMALMAYLGAGHTHARGDYQSVVRNGLNYLIKATKVGSRKGLPTGDLRTGEGNAGMYAHAIATIALCEAHALTNDVLGESLAEALRKQKREHGKDFTRADERDFREQWNRRREEATKLRKAAQLAVNFSMAGQDPKTGGWGYNFGNGEDTSVAGWHIMALQSAHAARLNLNRTVFVRANRFLDSVEADGGASYNYRPGNPGGGAAPAVGLLCRMYFGWKPDNPALERGIKKLAGSWSKKHGNMYYNYYATQAIHHWGGEIWDDWNEQNRDWLVATQVQKGPAAGSWKPAGGHAGKGGRLYQTCLSIMTLEVYYRHLPLYQRKQVDADL